MLDQPLLPAHLFYPNHDVQERLWACPTEKTHILLPVPCFLKWGDLNQVLTPRQAKSFEAFEKLFLFSPRKCRKAPPRPWLYARSNGLSNPFLKIPQLFLRAVGYGLIIPWATRITSRVLRNHRRIISSGVKAAAALVAPPCAVNHTSSRRR